MKNLLEPAHHASVLPFLGGNVLLAFDFDGTLAPIVDQPDAARLRDRTRELLAQVASVYPTVVISGRSQGDALKRLRGVGVKEVIGNHGLEPWREMGDFVIEVEKWVPVLEEALGFLRGVQIEDKHFSLAIHYRHSREKRLALVAILEAVSRLKGVRVLGGKEVVNVLPAGVPHKGHALQSARERLGCTSALFVGDDETDEDVFMLEEPGRLMSVRVGESRESAAEYFLENQEAMDTFLELVLSRRA